MKTITIYLLLGIFAIFIPADAMAEEDPWAEAVAPDSLETIKAVDSILTLIDSSNFEEFSCFLLDGGEVNMGLHCGMAEFVLKKYQILKRVETGFSFLAKKDERDGLRKHIASGEIIIDGNEKFTSLFFPGECGYLLVFGKVGECCYLRAIYDRHPDCCPTVQ